MASFTVGSIVYKIRVDTGQLNRDAARAKRTLGGLGDSGKVMGAQMVTAGRGLSVLSLAVAGGAAAVAKAAINFESGLAGVAKTTNFTKAGLAEFGEQVRDLSKEIPVGTGELLKIAEAAGQLGVKEKDILGFSKTMAALGETTNLSATQAATALARFNNIFGESNDNVEKLGSVIVDLGNNMATTEKEIVTMGSRLAGAAKTIGLTQTETLALAASLSSVGILAEAGGSAFSRTMLRMQSAMEVGGKKARLFAEVAGVSFDLFAATFRNEPMKAIQMFVEGLERTRVEGGNTTAILKDLNLNGIRVSDALRRASTAGDLLGDSVELANKAFEENTALQTEVQRRYETTAAQLEIFKNKVVDLAIDMGEVLIPAIINFVDAMEPVLGAVASAVNWFGKLPDPIKNMAFAMVAVTVAVGPMVLAVGMLTLAFGALSLSMAPVLIGFAAVSAALAIGITMWGNHNEKKKEALERIQAVDEALRSETDALEKNAAAAVTNMDVWIDNEELWTRLGVTAEELAAIVRTGTDDFGDLGNVMAWVAEATTGQLSTWDMLREEFAHADEASKALAMKLIDLGEAGLASGLEIRELLGDVDQAADAFDNLGDKTREQIMAWITAQQALNGGANGHTRLIAAMLAEAETSQDLIDILKMLETGVFNATEGNDAHVVSMNDAIAAAMDGVRAYEGLEQAIGFIPWDEGKDAVDSFVASLGESLSVSALMETALQAQAESTDEFAAAVKAAGDDGSVSWQDFADSSKVSLEQYNDALRAQIDATLNWAANVTELSARVPKEFRANFIGELEEMGPEYAMVLEDLKGLTDAELAEVAALWQLGGDLSGGNFSAATLAAITGGGEFAIAASKMIGWLVASGFAGGIKSGDELVKAAATGQANAVLFAYREATAQKSPSRKAMEIGLNVAKGLAIGIENGSALVVEASKFLAERGLEGIVDGFDEYGDAVGAIEEQLEGLQWERETRRMADQRVAVGELRNELAELQTQQVAASVAVTTAETAEDTARTALAGATTALAGAKRDAALVTENETYAINLANEAMEVAARKVADLTFELDLLTNSQRAGNDLTLESELSIARAIVSLDNQKKSVEDLEKALADAERGSDEYIRIQNKLDVANLQVEKSTENITRAQSDAITQGDAISETMDDIAIATHESEQAIDDLAQATADATDPLIGIEKELSAVEDAEKAVKDAVDAVAEANADALLIDQAVIDKKKDIADAQLALDISTLEFTLKWMKHMQEMRTAAEEETDKVNAALSGVGDPAPTPPEVQVRTEAALAKIAAVKAALINLNNDPVTSPVTPRGNFTPTTPANRNTATTAGGGGFGRLPTTPSVPSMAEINRIIFGGGLQQFAKGGVVQGSPGMAVPIIAHAGETITPAGGGGGDTIIVNITGRATREDAEEVVQALRDWERRRGAIPISVKG